jgi:chromate transporter
MNQPSLAVIFKSFLRLGATAFGGPAMIPYIRQVATSREWLTGEVLDDGLAFCQTIPGATAMQYAAYIGLRIRGPAGAAAAFIGFGLPACAAMMVLSALYVHYHSVTLIVAAFAGLEAIIISIMAHATLSFARKSLHTLPAFFIAAICGATFYVHVIPPLVLLAAAVLGMAFLADRRASQIPSAAIKLSISHATVFSIMAAAALLLVILFFFSRILFDLSTVMMRVDLLAFGGGFVSVPLMARYVVQGHHWLDSVSFMDGIALGQVTPGPIVITATFVGFLAAGPVGGCVATVSVFLPSYVMVIAAAPYFDRLCQHASFRKAIGGVTASFAGLLAAVTLQFVIQMEWNLTSISIASLGLLLLLLNLNILWVVALGTVAGLLIG